MKRKWIEIGQDLLVILLNHLMLISVCVTAVGQFKDYDHKVWLWSVLLIIPIFFYWARIKISNFFLFVALHLAVPVAFLFLPIHIMSKVMMVFTGIVYLIWSIWIRVKERRHGEGLLRPAVMTGSLAVMLLIETFYSKNGWEGIFIAMAIIYAAGYYMYIFTSRYLRFLTVNESSVANIPEAEIFYRGLRQASLYTAGVTALLVLSSSAKWISSMDSWLLSGIKNILIKFFKYLFMRSETTEETSGMQQLEELAPPDLSIFANDSGPVLFWVVLEKIARVGVVLFLIGLVVFGIVKGARSIWKGFHKSYVKDEKKINSGMDIRETCTIEKTQKVRNNLFSFLNNREKIRKIYRKQVLKHRTAIIGDLNAEDLEYMTAKECCDKFAAEQLKEMYEKARYSAEEIVSDDVRAAKSSGR